MRDGRLDGGRYTRPRNSPARHLPSAPLRRADPAKRRELSRSRCFGQPLYSSLQRLDYRHLPYGTHLPFGNQNHSRDAPLTLWGSVSMLKKVDGELKAAYGKPPQSPFPPPGRPYFVVAIACAPPRVWTVLEKVGFSGQDGHQATRRGYRGAASPKYSSHKSTSREPVAGEVNETRFRPDLADATHPIRPAARLADGPPARRALQVVNPRICAKLGRSAGGFRTLVGSIPAGVAPSIEPPTAEPTKASQ